MTYAVKIRSVYIEPIESPVEVHTHALTDWKNRCIGRLAPSWKDYSLMDFPPPEIPFISLTDLANAPLRSIYRFWGTGLTGIFGGDYTGKTPADVPPASLGISATGGCARLVNSRIPNCEVKEFTRKNGVLARAVILRLPFSDDGETVNHGLNMYRFEYLESGKLLDSFFDEIFAKIKPVDCGT